MTTLPPMQPAPSTTPPEYDGKTRFGTWQIPGPNGPQALVLSRFSGTGCIDGLVDGRTVLSLLKPSGDRTAIASTPATVDGHQVVVYAETRDLGQTILCDVFVDGYSLTTREPISVIPHRRAAIERLASGAQGYTSRRTSWLERDYVGLGIGIASILIVVVVEDSRSPTTAGMLASACILTADVLLYRVVRRAWTDVALKGWQPRKIRIARAAAAGAFAFGALLGLLLGMLATRAT
jgi:hypothetical protein